MTGQVLLKWKGRRENHSLGVGGNKYMPGAKFEHELTPGLQRLVDEGTLEVLSHRAGPAQEAQPEPATEPELQPKAKPEQEKGLKKRVRNAKGIGQKAANEIVDNYPTTELLVEALRSSPTAEDFGVGSVGEDKLEALRAEFL